VHAIPPDRDFASPLLSNKPFLRPASAAMHNVFIGASEDARFLDGERPLLPITPFF